MARRMIAMLLVAAACENAAAVPQPEALEPTSSTEPVATSTSFVVPTTSSPPASTTTLGPNAEAEPAPAAIVSTTMTPRFAATISPIDDALAARMAHSWRPGCPVGLDELRHLRLTYWGYDGAVHEGELVVNAAHAAAVAAAFAALFEDRFPIERMELVDFYGGDDDRSMAANNTSAFNCREVDGRPGVWSQHALGLAIDVNPLVNPWVRRDGKVLPSEGAAYADRSRAVPGLIVAGDAAVTAFAEIGWSWGGEWSSPDYQHFSATGN